MGGKEGEKKTYTRTHEKSQSMKSATTAIQQSKQYQQQSDKYSFWNEFLERELLREFLFLFVVRVMCWCMRWNNNNFEMNTNGYRIGFRVLVLVQLYFIACQNWNQSLGNELITSVCVCVCVPMSNCRARRSLWNQPFSL